MDDANVPSLMSLVYLDKKFLKDKIYLNTRKFLIVTTTYFLKGKGEGQVSAHMQKQNLANGNNS